MLPRLYVGAQHFDRLGQLRVAALGHGARLGPQDVVRDGAVFFHVFAVADGEPAAEGKPQRADVHDGDGAGADDSAGSRDADERNLSIVILDALTFIRAKT